MTKAIAQTYSVLHENVKLINYVFVVACLLLVSLYVMNIFSVVSKTVSLQKVESKISLLSSSVNNLDSEYLALSGKITPDNLSEFGMTKGQVSEYITRSVGVKLGIASDFNHVALVNER
jgi:hypothetical protein